VLVDRVLAIGHCLGRQRKVFCRAASLLRHVQHSRRPLYAFLGPFAFFHSRHTPSLCRAADVRHSDSVRRCQVFFQRLLRFLHRSGADSLLASTKSSDSNIPVGVELLLDFSLSVFFFWDFWEYHSTSSMYITPLDV